jgi:hypothetical protein
METSAQLHASATLSPRETASSSVYSQFEMVAERNIYSPAGNRISIVQPLASHCTDSSFWPIIERIFRLSQSSFYVAELSGNALLKSSLRCMSAKYGLPY